jgi:undecaprenyl-diphosphatase
MRTIGAEAWRLFTSEVLPMNDFSLATLLGIIEGLTEFLPISSTAHLRIVESLLGLELGSEYWKMFSIVIQLGAILAVVFYFWQRIVNLVKSFKATFSFRHPLVYVTVAFVTTAIPSFILSKVISKNLESMRVIGTSLLVGGLVLFFTERRKRKTTVSNIEQMNARQGAFIGLIQILSAVFPGVSRSMSTILAAEWMGFTRTAALEFSFFLSIPTMFAAGGYSCFKFFKHESSMTSVLSSFHQWAVLILGFGISFVVAYATIHWLLSWVRQHSFIPFAVYRVALGMLVLTCWYACP